MTHSKYQSGITHFTPILYVNRSGAWFVLMARRCCLVGFVGGVGAVGVITQIVFSSALASGPWLTSLIISGMSDCTPRPSA